MERDNIILSAEQLSIGYSNKKESAVIADGININLSQGKLIALIGANGIGKSTLLRTLTGIQMPLKGIVLLKGRKVSDYNAKELAQTLGIVLTESLPPST